ncbi:hypothetical protein M8C21_029848 [Ambrosia artemisiifolia]|uniref:UBC core domain-containing protein n=1 Tax=Ambrosia artemisiifolia TaxID=4212 RepID=A0AAD5CP61_AMBAR|nr:hypothetical protein M8C21_029848 [Ambrosia artemisiifolia]
MTTVENQRRQPLADISNMNRASNMKSNKTKLPAVAAVNAQSALKRLQKELMELMMSAESWISAFPVGEDFFRWRGTISGGVGTVFEGMEYKLSLLFPKDYPYNPPNVKFETGCYHPNVDGFGNMCLDILQDKWSCVYDVRSVLISIQSLLEEPNICSPMNKEAALLWSNKQGYELINILLVASLGVASMAAADVLWCVTPPHTFVGCIGCTGAQFGFLVSKKIKNRNFATEMAIKGSKVQRRNHKAGSGPAGVFLPNIGRMLKNIINTVASDVKDHCCGIEVKMLIGLSDPSTNCCMFQQLVDTSIQNAASGHRILLPSTNCCMFQQLVENLHCDDHMLITAVRESKWRTCISVVKGSQVAKFSKSGFSVNALCKVRRTDVVLLYAVKGTHAY